MPLRPVLATTGAVAALTCASAAIITPATPADATTGHRPAAAASAKAPALSATARAHGLTAANGAVPGWTYRHLTAARHTAVPAAGVLPMTAGGPVRITAASSTLGPGAGVDVSSWSGTVDWASFATLGVRFAYVKTTEGTYYTSPVAATQTAGARHAGMYVGAYHFANPKQSSGAAQADYFVNHGGGWTPGTLPGVVDLEWNPYSGTMCYNLTQSQMAAWISSFQQEYQRRTGTWPVIYTARPWWNSCVGNSVTSAVIAARSNLWLSTPGATLGSMPYSWNSQRIWQYAYSSAGYDIDQFNGTETMLAGMALAGR